MESNHNTSGSPGVNCYSIRRVNPFLGVLQVIATDQGRAVSANGLSWSIEMLGEQPRAWGSLNMGSQPRAFFRYGLWSLEDGLVTGMLSPRLNTEALKMHVKGLLEQVMLHLDELPFKLIDRRELWLFDKHQQQPLALLASAAPHETSRTSGEPKSWTCSAGAKGLSSQHKFPRTHQLEELVRQQAGFNVIKQWVLREQDGSGRFEAAETVLDARSFPVYLISQHWTEPDQAGLVNEYIRWISPALLTLQHLTSSQREYLETNLNSQAISIEHHWRLYPAVINSKTLKAARVQSRLQKAGADSN